MAPSLFMHSFKWHHCRKHLLIGCPVKKWCLLSWFWTLFHGLCFLCSFCFILYLYLFSFYSVTSLKFPVGNQSHLFWGSNHPSQYISSSHSQFARLSCSFHTEHSSLCFPLCFCLIVFLTTPCLQLWFCLCPHVSLQCFDPCLVWDFVRSLSVPLLRGVFFVRWGTSILGGSRTSWI